MFYLIVIGLYLIFIGLVLYGLHRVFGMGVIGGIVVSILLVLAPFWDVFMAKGILMNFNRQHAPLQEIFRTVDNPDSVLWLDDVWPGFDGYGRHWMVESYLDGVHLQSLALNGDDGKIYLYQALVEDFAVSEWIRPEFESTNEKLVLLKKETNKIWKKHVAESKEAKIDKWPWPIARRKYERETKELKLKIKELESRLKNLGYKTLRKQEIDKIFARPEIYTSRADIPPTKYTVHLRPLPLYDWQKKFVWCDEITILDTERDKEIAFSRRCLGYNPFAIVNYAGDPYSRGARLGDEQVYGFDDKVLFGYAGVRDNIESIKSRLERSSYNRRFGYGWERRHKKQGAMNNAK